MTELQKRLIDIWQDFCTGQYVVEDGKDILRTPEGDLVYDSLSDLIDEVLYTIEAWIKEGV